MVKKRSRRPIIVLAAVLAAVALILLAARLDADIDITQITYADDAVPSGFVGFRIMQVSDLHGEVFGAGESELIEAAEEIRPDIIVITGDLLKSHRPDGDPAMDFVAAAVRICPVYFVAGNHENYGDYEETSESLAAAGAAVLDNRSVILEKGADSIVLTGIQDLNFFGSKGELREVLLPLAAPDSFSILLAHRPDFIAAYEEAGYDLVFTGHTHGGQVRIPGVGAIYVPGQGFFPKYDGGVYKVGGTTMVVSRGLGSSVIPLRLFDPPEVVVVTLEKQAD